MPMFSQIFPAPVAQHLPGAVIAVDEPRRRFRTHKPKGLDQLR